MEVDGAPETLAGSSVAARAPAVRNVRCYDAGAGIVRGKSRVLFAVRDEREGGIGSLDGVVRQAVPSPTKLQVVRAEETLLEVRKILRERLALRLVLYDLSVVANVGVKSWLVESSLRVSGVITWPSKFVTPWPVTGPYCVPEM